MTGAASRPVAATSFLEATIRRARSRRRPKKARWPDLPRLRTEEEGDSNLEGHDEVSSGKISQLSDEQGRLFGCLELVYAVTALLHHVLTCSGANSHKCRFRNPGVGK